MIRATRPSRRMPIASGALLLTGSILTLGAAAPAHALTWNWTADTGGCPSSGTLETDGSNYVANQSYRITAISGDICSWTVTGLNTSSSNQNSVNFISWDGSQSSPILALTNGIEFKAYQPIASQIASWRWWPGGSSTSSGFAPVLQTDYNGAITLGQLSPANPTNPVPGPLPLMGAAAAFGWSRKLRRRISTSPFRL